MKKYLIFLFLLGSFTCKAQWYLDTTGPQLIEKITKQDGFEMECGKRENLLIWSWETDSYKYFVTYKKDYDFPVLSAIVIRLQSDVKMFIEKLTEMNYVVFSNTEWRLYKNGKIVSVKYTGNENNTTFTMEYIQ